MYWYRRSKIRIIRYKNIHERGKERYEKIKEIFR